MSEQTAIRIDEDLLKRIDEYRRQKEEENPGLEISRSSIIRMLLNKGLALVEKGYVLDLIINGDKLIEDLQREAKRLAQIPESLNETVIAVPNLKKDI